MGEYQVGTKRNAVVFKHEGVNLLRVWGRD